MPLTVKSCKQEKQILT